MYNNCIHTITLGLVLELAPKGSLKGILKEYGEAQNHIQPPAIQATIIQVLTACILNSHISELAGNSI